MVDRHVHEFLPGRLGLEIDDDVAIYQVRMAGQIGDLPPGHRVGADEDLRWLVQTIALRLVACQRMMEPWFAMSMIDSLGGMGLLQPMGGAWIA